MVTNLSRLSLFARQIGCLAFLLLATGTAVATAGVHHVQIRDITSIAGVRENQLVGYGIVVGLAILGIGVRLQFTTQTLANAMRRMGVLIAPSTCVSATWLRFL
jgi:flagellar P-ring protein precursor FlgI